METKKICKKCNKEVFSEPDNNGDYFCNNCGALKKKEVRSVKA